MNHKKKIHDPPPTAPPKSTPSPSISVQTLNLSWCLCTIKLGNFLGQFLCPGKCKTCAGCTCQSDNTGYLWQSSSSPAPAPGTHTKGILSKTNLWYLKIWEGIIICFHLYMPGLLAPKRSNKYRFIFTESSFRLLSYLKFMGDIGWWQWVT